MPISNSHRIMLAVAIVLIAGILPVVVANGVGSQFSVRVHGSVLNEVNIRPAVKRPLRDGDVAARRTATRLLEPAIASTLVKLMTRSGKHDKLFYRQGVWHSTDRTCFRCNIGPGVAAAALAKVQHSHRWARIARATFDTAIANHRRADGSFGPAAPQEGGNSIQTTMFVNELGEVYLLLHNGLDTAQRRTWRRAMIGGADYLIRDRNLTYYTNGNIALSVALSMLLTAKVTGEERFHRDFDLAWRFALHPPKPRWAGFGLRYSRPPHHPGDKTAAGYLTESGSGGTGFDPSYTQFQADILSRMYVLTGSQRALKLLNVITNQLLTRVTRSGWRLNISNGTRHAPANRYDNFDTPALVVLAGSGYRPKFGHDIASQSRRTKDAMVQVAVYPEDSRFYGIGDAPTTYLLFASGV